jgi:hypothetical protein
MLTWCKRLLCCCVAATGRMLNAPCECLTVMATITSSCGWIGQHPELRGLDLGSSSLAVSRSRVPLLSHMGVTCGNAVMAACSFIEA